MKTIMNLCVECAEKSFGTDVMNAVKNEPKALAKCDICGKPNEACFELDLIAYNIQNGIVSQYAVSADHKLFFPFNDSGY